MALPATKTSTSKSHKYISGCLNTGKRYTQDTHPLESFRFTTENLLFCGISFATFYPHTFVDFGLHKQTEYFAHCCFPLYFSRSLASSKFFNKIPTNGKCLNNKFDHLFWYSYGNSMIIYFKSEHIMTSYWYLCEIFSSTSDVLSPYQRWHRHWNRLHSTLRNRRQSDSSSVLLVGVHIGVQFLLFRND